MQTNLRQPVQFEFYFSSSDTLLLVETAEDFVTIRATRATFSDARKEYFIRELAAEGFIPDEYRWFTTGGNGVRWLLDRSWLVIDPTAAAKTRRWMLRFLLSAALFWILTVSLLFFKAH